MYLSKFQDVFAKHRNPNDKETGGARRPPLLALSPFANCWIFHELLCFALNQHLFIIDDGDDDFNDLKACSEALPSQDIPSKNVPSQMKPGTPARPVKCTLSKYTLQNCWENPKYICPNCIKALRSHQGPPSIYKKSLWKITVEIMIWGRELSWSCAKDKIHLKPEFTFCSSTCEIRFSSASLNSLFN